MKLRKLVFWPHLVIGVVAGLVILVMSVTGVLLMYERQIVEWADRGERVAPSAARMPVEALLAEVSRARGAAPTSLTMRAAPDATALVAFGRDETVLVDPYTGALLGPSAPKARAFFHQVTDLHRWLALEGKHRPIARAVTGASNLVFLLLVLSGIYLWWPRNWTWPNLRPVTWFRGGLRGHARDFNWHNTIGLWTAFPLAIIVASGVVISYPWAGNLVYKIAGSQPPQGPPAGPPRRVPNASRDVPLDGLNLAWQRAERQDPAWRSIAFQIPMSPRARRSPSRSTRAMEASRTDARHSRLTAARAKSAPGRPMRASTPDAAPACGCVSRTPAKSLASPDRPWRASRRAARPCWCGLESLWRGGAGRPGARGGLPGVCAVRYDEISDKCSDLKRPVNRTASILSRQWQDCPRACPCVWTR